MYKHDQILSIKVGTTRQTKVIITTTNQSSDLLQICLNMIHLYKLIRI